MQPYTKQYISEARPIYYDSSALVPSGFDPKKPPQFGEFRPSSEEFPSLSQSRSAYIKDSVKRLERNAKPNPNAASFVPGGFQPPPPSIPQPIKPRSADAELLQGGLDLTRLELPERNLSGLLESPFTGLAASEAEFSLPSCYFTKIATLKLSHFQKFSLSTLFYLFYSMPGKHQQTLAAEDLYRREWQFHPPTLIWYQIKGIDRQLFSIQSWTVEKTTRVPENLLTREEFRSQRGR